ncbi:MAG TPA: ABC transporter transmembrane domain-containing protein, partial [Spirochaetota bacterium]|nr:ABC transporter transmembrane domain-containing protein [Spirochaetota bacterium]
MKILLTLLPYLKKYRFILTAGLLFLILQNYAWKSAADTIKATLDEIAAANKRETVLNYLLAISWKMITAYFCMVLMRYLMIGTSRRVENDIRQSIFHKLIYLPESFFMKHRRGDIISRTTNDLNDVRTLLGPGIMYIPNSLFRLIIFAPVLVSLNARLSFYLLLLIIFLLVLIILIMPRIRPLFQAVQKHIGKINNRAYQLIAGITTVRLHTMEKSETKRFARLNKEYIQKQMHVIRYMAFLWPFFMFLFTSGELIILYLGGLAVQQGKMTWGDMYQFSLMFAMLTFPVLSLGWIMSLIQQGIAALNRINEILKQPLPRISKPLDPGQGPVQYYINRLSFTYPGKKKPAVDNISFTIKPGETLGLTGPIG